MSRDWELRIAKRASFKNAKVERGRRACRSKAEDHSGKLARRCAAAILLGRGGPGVPVQSIERELVAIFAEIAGYCGGSGFLDSGISQKLAGPEKA